AEHRARDRVGDPGKGRGPSGGERQGSVGGAPDLELPGNDTSLKDAAPIAYRLLHRPSPNKGEEREQAAREPHEYLPTGERPRRPQPRTGDQQPRRAQRGATGRDAKEIGRASCRERV